MKRTILCVISVLLLLALILASNLLDRQMERLDRQKAVADGLLTDQRYGEAIPAYGQLLQKTPVSWSGRDKAYLEQGMDGVLRSVDALLETLEGARYLADSGAIEDVLALATHPDVPASFREDLAARAAKGTAMLEAEAERIRREEEEREAQRRQGLLNEALEARAQGRLEEALELAKASGLQPELIEEIEAEILQKRDEELTAKAQAALDAMNYTGALDLAEQVHDEALRETLKTEIISKIDRDLTAETQEALDALKFSEALALAEQIHDETLRETLKTEIMAESDKNLAAETQAALDALKFSEALALTEQIHDEALREALKAEIMAESDKNLAAQAREALNALKFTEATTLAEQVHDETLRETLKAEIIAEIDTDLAAQAREAINALQFTEATTLAEQVHDETLRETLKTEILAGIDTDLAAQAREAMSALQFTEATALAEQVHDETLRETLKAEIEAGIVRERDKGLAAEVRTAIDALDFTEAAALAEQVHDEALQEALKAEIEAGIIREHDKGVAADARAALDDMRIADALALVEQMTDEAARAALRQEIDDGWAKILGQLREKYKNTLWAGAWYTLALGNDVYLTGDRRYEGLDVQLGHLIGGVFGWMVLSDGKVTLAGDTLGATEAAAQITDARDGAMGWNHALIRHSDGTVTNLGNWTYGRDGVAEWTGIVQVAAGAFHSLGLTVDGHVVAAGLDLDGQCQVAEWERVTAIAAGLRHSVALFEDGRVAAVGDNSFGQCDVSDWKNIVDVRCGANYTLGLTADGRLLAVGDNGCGQCNVSGWKDVIAFDGGLWHTVALLQNGQVVCTGANDHSQCALHGTALFETGLADVPAGTFADAETEFVYEGEEFNGPWLYFSGEGCVIVSFDAGSGKIKATRADLICTWGHPPVGILSGGGNKPTQSVSAWHLAKQNRAVFALTGDYFTFGYNADGLQIRRGHVFKQENDEVGFGFFPDGTMRIIDPDEVTAEDLLSQGVNDSWVFGPALIENGEALDIHKHPLSYNDVTMRTVMASLCPYHHMGAAYGFSTLAQVVEDLLSCGCDIAYNLDGGRSSMLVFMGKAVNKSAFIGGGWRGLQDMVGFLTSELVPNPK